MPTMRRKFLRRDWNKMLRLGGRRKKLKWRRSKGRHAKIRQKWKGYSQMPSPGYKTPRSIRGLVENKHPVMINNLSDLMKIKSNEIGIVSKTLGQKKKIELAKKALELKIHLENLDASKYLDEIKKAQEAKKKTAPGTAAQVQSEPKKEEKKVEGKGVQSVKKEKSEAKQ
jgi:large subunit ribosomal protein L32e